MKTISVIIPAYNAEKNIRVTIQSLLNQTESNFEIIVVDDGSTDKTYKVAKNILEQSGFNNYKIFKQKNKGVSAARNKGIEEATKDFLYFLDSDDYVTNNMIEILKKSINKNKSQIIAWGFNIIKRNGEIISKYSDTHKLVLRDKSGISALNEIINEGSLAIWTGSAVYDRNFIKRKKLNFTINCNAGQDLEFIYKSLANASNVIFIDKILSFYVQTEGSTTNTYDIRKFDAVLAIKRTADYLRKHIDKRNIDSEGYDLIYGIENEIPLHYRYNFTAAYSHMDVNKDIFNIKKTKNFMRDIKLNYPNINKGMKLKLIRRKDKNFRDFIKNKSLAISPLIYFNLLDLEGLMVLIKNKLLR